MKARFLAMLSLLVASSSFAQLPYTQEQVIAYAKSIVVHTLDASLPSQRLEDWLQTGPPHAHIWQWIVADTCDLKPDDPDADYPLCAQVRFGRDGENGEFLVQVGTIRCRHPIGIPAGAEMTAIRPFLSKRLVGLIHRLRRFSLDWNTRHAQVALVRMRKRSGPIRLIAPGRKPLDSGRL